MESFWWKNEWLFIGGWQSNDYAEINEALGVACGRLGKTFKYIFTDLFIVSIFNFCSFLGSKSANLVIWVVDISGIYYNVYFERKNQTLPEDWRKYNYQKQACCAFPCLAWCTIIDGHFLPPVHLDRKNNYWWNCFLSAHLIKDCV